MQGQYADILSRISEAPSWFDDGGVPRYGPFVPELVTSIHAQEIVLVRIECQACGHSFDVAMTVPHASRLFSDGPNHALLRDHIHDRSLHYGDPPNIGCCDAGPSMNSVPREVLEYWYKPRALGYGLACSWPRRKKPDGTLYPPMSIIVDSRYAMTFRRDPTFEGIDLTPDWAC